MSNVNTMRATALAAASRSQRHDGSLTRMVRPITFANKYGIIGATADLSDSDVRRIITEQITVLEPGYAAAIKRIDIIQPKDWPNDGTERTAADK